LITDIVGSTQAIQAERDQEVNGSLPSPFGKPKYGKLGL
jgi:hypothetical protein